MLFIYTYFVRNNISTGAHHLEEYYSWFQDVNVMMLIGFGFLMTFIRTYSWGALAFTFFINTVIIQYYIVWHGLWHKVLGEFGPSGIPMDMQTLISASYAVAAVLISFG